MGSKRAGGPVAVLGRLRVWSVGLVAWGILLAALGIDNSGDASRSGQAWCREAGSLLGFLLVVSIVRIVWPMRSTGQNGSRLVAGGKIYRVFTFLGSSHTVSQSHVTTTSVQGSVYTDALGDVHGRIESSSRTSVHDRFSLTARSGAQHTVQVQDANVPLGEGQRLTAIWAVPPGGKSGPYIAFVNHSTGRTTWAPRGLYRLVFGGRVGWAVLWALLCPLLLAVGGKSGAAVGAFAVGFGALIIGSRLQAAFFRSVGSRRLLAAVRAEADADRTVAAIPTPAPSPTVAALVVPPPPPSAPAGWLSDPTGRSQLRFWDGARWTDHVSTGGVASIDTF